MDISPFFWSADIFSMDRHHSWHGSHAKQWHPCNRVHNDNEPNEEGNVGILETGMGMSHEEGH